MIVGEPTTKQLRVLAYIARYWAKSGYAPSLLDVSRHFKWASAAAAAFHIKKLEKSGLVIWPRAAERHHYRAVRVTPGGRALLENIRMGRPIRTEFRGEA